jgi:hypothetical protein
MTTLITVGNSSGVVGRCDAKCYNAKGGKCKCVCGGANHGAGLAAAQSNTNRLAASWIEKYKRENPHLKITHAEAAFSLPLFSSEAEETESEGAES